MKVIHVLRSQCEECHLDKMEVFYRIPNATPKQLMDKLKPEIRKKFKQKYKCTHTIKFSHEIDERYKWDEVNNKPVAR